MYVATPDMNRSEEEFFFYDEDLKHGSWLRSLQYPSLIPCLFPLLKQLPFLHFTTEANFTTHTFPTLSPTSGFLSSPTSAQQINALFPSIHGPLPPSFLLTQVLSKPSPNLPSPPAVSSPPELSCKSPARRRPCP